MTIIHVEFDAKQSRADEKKQAIMDLMDDLLGEQLKGQKFTLDNLEQSMSELLDELRVSVSKKVIERHDVLSHDCPKCQTRMQIKERTEHTARGLVTYRYLRRSYVCPECGHWEKPLDELLECPDGYSLELKKAMLILGKNMPFEEAADTLEKIMGIKVSTRTIRELTEGVGARIAADEDHRVNHVVDNQGQIKNTENPSKKKDPIADAAYLMMDGTMVQTRVLGWKEVKNGMLFRGRNLARIDKHHRLVLAKKYFSVFNGGESSLEKFLNRATQECHDFEFDRYERRVILGDGARWIWDYANMLHPGAIQILDYYHASEYLGKAWQSVASAYSDKTEWARAKDTAMDQLWEGDIEAVMAALYEQTKTKEVVDCLRYFESNKSRMRYGEYRRLGLDIGSGAIESAHRIIVQKRMKQSGMHWGKANVQSIIALRAKFLSGQWNEIVDEYLRKAA